MMRRCPASGVRNKKWSVVITKHTPQQVHTTPRKPLLETKLRCAARIVMQMVVIVAIMMIVTVTVTAALKGCCICYRQQLIRGHAAVRLAGDGGQVDGIPSELQFPASQSPRLPQLTRSSSITHYRANVQDASTTLSQIAAQCITLITVCGTLFTVRPKGERQNMCSQQMHAPGRLWC